MASSQLVTRIQVMFFVIGAMMVNIPLTCATSTSVSSSVVMTTDPNLYDLVFTEAIYNVTTEENCPPGSEILQVKVQNVTGAGVNVVYGIDHTNFSITANGSIFTTSVLDYEVSQTFTLQVVASSLGSPSLNATAFVNIFVKDVNDNIPVFSPGVYTSHVDENTASGWSIVTVTATDRDSLEAGGTISYSIVSGNSNGTFSINASSGVIIVDNNTFLDYEYATSHKLVVKADDGGNRSVEAVVIVNVDPQNEMTPTFSPNSSSVSLAENSSVGTVVAIVTAIDTDIGPDGQLTYRFESALLWPFSINPSSGRVELVAGLDREKNQSYILQILATDAGLNSSARTGTYSLTVNITDVNDVTPSCDETFYTAFISENASRSASVVDIICSDGDLDPNNLNNAILFNISTGNENNLFSVNGSGHVTVSQNATFDRETTSSYTLMLHVVDQASSGQLTSTVTLQVVITDENDNEPTFTSNLYSVSVAENSPLGYTVTRVNATDLDTGSNAAISYNIINASQAGKFALDSVKGVVTVAGPLDYETCKEYSLVISAVDHGTFPHSASTKVSINITNINDNPPVCSSPVYAATVDENDASHLSVANVSCPDADSASVMYSLNSSTFAIGNTSGEVTLMSALDYEMDQTYTLIISATDGTFTATTLLQVTVSDVNEFSPVFSNTTPSAVSVSEDAHIGFVIIHVNAFDADASDATLTFSISGGNGSNKFTIDSTTGALQVAGVLDREQVSAYTLNVTVADGAGTASHATTTSIAIAVTDVNDNDPACSPMAYSASVSETATVGFIVASLTCSDVDSSTSVLNYTISLGNNGSAFALDSGTGVLTVASALDYETQTEFDLRVEISDQGTIARRVTVPVTISIMPVNEFAPTFSLGGNGKKVIPESSTVGTSVINATATDSDKGFLHGTVRYTIASGNTLGDFAIDALTGEIRVAKPLDRERTPSYSLTIRASDDFTGSANQTTSDIVVSINITDSNDNFPIFTPAFYTTSILETAVVGGTVLTVTVKDDDIGTNAAVNVSILSGNTDDAFAVNGTRITLTRLVDYETKKFYDILLQGTDGGSPALSSQARVLISISPVNEDAPVLTNSMISATVPESLSLGSLIYTASATDSDQDGANDSVITYSIIAGDTTPNSFIVDEKSGEVRVFSRLDYDTPPQFYFLTLEARDGGGLTDIMLLNITLTDVNDHTPQFPLNTYTTTLNETVAAGTSVITVIATDHDSGSNGRVTYSITGGSGQGHFAINASTGLVVTKGKIDYEFTPVLYIVVQAIDGGTPPLSSSVNVRITVVDLNDNPPVTMPDDFAVTVLEGVAKGTHVAVVAAMDADSAASRNNEIVFHLNSSEFQVDPNTGIVTTAIALDRETRSSYVLLVTATDQGGNPGKNTATATVSVFVSDVNDNTPVIIGSYERTVNEDELVGSIVLTVNATDRDAGDNSRLNFTIRNGNTGNDFRIIASSGMVQLSKALDRERTALYLLEIVVSDNAATSPRSASVTATLTIGDVNDNRPQFTNNSYSFSVKENTGAGFLIGKITATDADIDTNANLLYRVVHVWKGDNSHFSLNPATGELSTTVVTLDREAQDAYVIWCRVTDQGTPPREDNVNVTVSVMDVNDNIPVISRAVYTGTVSENTAVGTSIMTITATDADAGENSAITFSIDKSVLAGAEACVFFQIDNVTGEIYVKSNIDYESRTSFTFVIVAVDGGSQAFSATTSVLIIVLDVNDNAPIFSPAFYDAEVAYAGQCSNAVVIPDCTDDDTDTNGDVACYLVQSTYDYLFAVDGPSCALTTQAIAAANHRYIIEVQCRDSGVPFKIATTPATVRVDTFIPDEVVVRFHLSISKADFAAQSELFIKNLQSLVRVQYKDAVVRLWCVDESDGGDTSFSRRRLLQSGGSLDVSAYAFAESPENITQDKPFLTKDQLLAFVSADATGNPSPAIRGGAWDYYGIEKVSVYTEGSKPWIQTTEGIVMTTVCCVLGLILLGLLIYFLARCHRRSKRPVTPMRATFVEPIRTSNPTLDGNLDLEKVTSTLQQWQASITSTLAVATAYEKFNKKRTGNNNAEIQHTVHRPAMTKGYTTLVNKELHGTSVYESNTKTNHSGVLESPLASRATLH